jgi:hypothetical protein
VNPDFLPPQITEQQERQLYRDVDEADKAKRILDDPLVVQYFQNIKQECFDRWVKTTSSQERDEIWRMMWAVEKLKQEFGRTAAVGEVAKAELTRWQTLKERIKQFRQAG